MSTHLSIHCIKWIRASSGGTQGAPLTIEVKSDSPLPNSITLFTDDQVLADRLVEVINDVFDAREQEKRIVDTRVANEAAAYDALDKMQDDNHRADKEEMVF